MVTIDNQSSRAVNGAARLGVVTDDGSQVEFTPIMDFISKWDDPWSSGGSKEKASNSGQMYNQGVALYNKSIKTVYPGAKDARPMATSDKLTTIKRVFIHPLGLMDGPVEAEKVG